MNTIIKKAKQILKKNDIENIKKNSKDFYIIQTANLLQKYPCKIYYKKIDWLTAEIKTINSNILNLVSSFMQEYNHKRDIEKYDGDITKFTDKQILDNFYLVNLGVIFGGQLQVYGIYDLYKNKVGSFVFKVKNTGKNYNAYTYLELTGLFFHFYEKYFDSILNYFGVDRESNGILKRIDYCLDLVGLEVPQVLEFLRELHQRQRVKNHNGLTNSDLKALLETNRELQFGKTETGKTFKNNFNTLIVYDKVLDIAQNYLKRQIDGKNPYQDYLDSDFPITRIELKKISGSISRFQDHSINSMISNIEANFFDYLKKYFYFDLSLLVDIYGISLNGKKIYLAKEEKEKSIFHSFQMAKAYLKNIETICGKDELYKFLFKLYPEIENINSLDLLDEFEKIEYIQKLFE